MKLETWLILLTAALLLGQAAPSVPKPVKIMRLDCGTFVANDLDGFNDTGAMKGRGAPLTSSCYLIRHGDDYMIWDTGISAEAKGKPLNQTAAFDFTLKATLVEQLATLGIKPAQVTRVGVSHYHFDHTGQAASFPTATLLIGKGDLDALKAGAPGVDAKPVAPWVTGGGKVDAITGDKDVFGDGAVTMIDLPGHTPGHHGLMVRLAKRGTLLLTGDQAHFQENYDSNGVPRFNVNRADTLASFDRFKGLAKVSKATVIIQHDSRDLGKLPAFPNWAD